MKLDIRCNGDDGEQIIYIEIDEWTFCIDNTTGEQVVHKWITEDETKIERAQWEDE